MGLGWDDICDAFKTVGEEIIDIAAIGGTWLGSLAGWLLVEGWNFAFNRGHRKLSAKERDLMLPFFSGELLDKIKIHEDAVLAAPGSKSAMGMGEDIYWEGKLRICHDSKGGSQARLLAHELVHCRQAESWYGAVYLATTYGSQCLTPKNDFEEEAKAYADRIAADLEKRRVAVCADKPLPPVASYCELGPDPCGWGAVLLG